MSRSRLRIRGIVIAATVVAGLAAPLTVPAATRAESGPTEGLAYVALGDSYAAGYGLPDPTGRPTAACGQTVGDYPHLVAEQLGLDLDDVTCAGATTSDLVSTRQHGLSPQVDALGPSTRVVTVTIGGNDTGLFSTASKCVALSAAGPVLGFDSPTCRAALAVGGRDQLADAISAGVTAGLQSAFREIADRAPNAVVVVVGYPTVFPDVAHVPSGGCFRPVVDQSVLTNGLPKNGFPFTATDVSYFAGIQAKLDRAMRATTDAAGFTYVSTLADSAARSACASSGAYVSGITLTATPGFRDISLEPGSLHPTTAGTRFLADRAAFAVERALAAVETESASPTSVPSAGSGVTVDLIWLVLAGLVVVFAAVVFFAGRGIRRARR